MYTKQLSGTRAEIESQLLALSFPIDVLAAEAVRSYAIGHIPKHDTGRFKMSLSVHSIINAASTTLAGHITVVVTE